MEFQPSSISADSDSDDDKSNDVIVPSKSANNEAKVRTIIADAKLPGNSNGNDAKSSDAEFSSKIDDAEVCSSIADAKVPAKKSVDEHFKLEQCRVCHRTLSFVSQCQAQNVFKICACCKVYGCLHIKCAEQVSTAFNPSYKFNSLSYEEDTSTSLYCFVCYTKCFVCGRNHRLSPTNKDQDISIESCVQCNK